MYMMYQKKIKQIHKSLGIPNDYGKSGGLPCYSEEINLVYVGIDLYGRKQFLNNEAAYYWKKLKSSALSEDIELFIVSGFRSFDYQASLIKKKLDNGQSISEILAINAAPGFSQHHTGCAIDITTQECEPLTEEFEKTEAFAWLSINADSYGFSMTYPRNNRYGFIYEPWHWAMNEKLVKKF